MWTDVTPFVWIFGLAVIAYMAASLYDRATGRDLRAECCEHCGEVRDAVEDQTRDILPLLEEIRDQLHESAEQAEKRERV